MWRLVPALVAATMTAAAADPFSEPGAKAVVLIFTRTDCPISNRYAPEVSRLSREYESRGVKFWLVYPGREIKGEDIEAHRAEFGYPMPGIQDPEQKLVTRARARVTPEAAVFVRSSKTWNLTYRGRIDDQYPDLGKHRPSAQRRDLEEVIKGVLAGAAATYRETRAVGCVIADLQ